MLNRLLRLIFGKKKARYIYVCCLVKRADVHVQSLVRAIHEKATGVAQADIIRDLDNGSLSFYHILVRANSVEDAYTVGQKRLVDDLLDDKKHQSELLTWNDYVIPLT